MTTRINPITSKLAHDSIKDHKAAVYGKIIQALNEMRVGGTSEEIAYHLNVDHSKIWKRMKELQDAGIIFNVGITRPTSSGRQAMVRQLVSLKEPPKNLSTENKFQQLPLF